MFFLNYFFGKRKEAEKKINLKQKLYLKKI